MNNNKYLKLDVKKFFEILKEEYTSIREDDVLTSHSSLSEDYSTLSTTLKERASTLTPEDKQAMDSELDRALKIGRTNIDYILYSKNKEAFLYFTDALATIVVQNRPDAENAKNALMEVFSPYSKKDSKDGKFVWSDFFNRVGRFTSGEVDSSKKDSTYTIDHESDDIRLEGFYNGFKEAIEKFNPQNPKSSFNSILSYIIKSRQIDAWRKFKGMEVVKDEKGNKVLNKKGKPVYKMRSTPISLSTPLGDDDSGTVGDNIAQSPEDTMDNKHDKDYNKRFYNAFISAVKTVLEFDGENKILDFFNLYTIKNLELQEIAKILGVTLNNLSRIKWGYENKLTKFIDDIENLMSEEMGDGIELPFPNDKFRFPRLRIDKAIKENKNYILDFNIEMSPNDYLEYTKFIIDEGKIKLQNIQCIYNNLNKTFSYLNEGYNGNHDVLLKDFVPSLIDYIEESKKIAEVTKDDIEALKIEIYKIYKSGKEVSGIGDWPEASRVVGIASKEILEQLNKITDELDLLPPRLSEMLRKVNFLLNNK